MGMGPEQPRERLESLGSDALSDAELVALVLRTGSPGIDALLLARRLLARCGGLRGVARSGGGELRDSPGMGPAKTAGLLAALEIGRRLAIHRLEPGQSASTTHSGITQRNATQTSSSPTQALLFSHCGSTPTASW